MMNYKDWCFGQNITIETLPNKNIFDKMYWDLLPQEIQLDRMVKLADKLLDKEDEWANKTMENRRNKRKFIRPRSKTESMWS